MTVTISTSLVATGEPASVQLVIDGVASGSAYTVVGVLGDSTWPVPGGVGVGTGGQIVLLDNRTALGTAFRYRVVTDGQVYESGPVTVPSADRYVIQSLDGDTTVRFVWQSNGLPREPPVRSATYDVPGRPRPPSRTAPGGDGGGALRIRTSAAGSTAMRTLLRAGRPVVIRTDGAVRDWPAVELLLLQSGPSVLWEAYDAVTGSLSTDRVWSLSYVLVDDPQPSTVLSAWSWDDFDDAGLTWDQLDALALTWDEFDTYPWGQL